MNFLLNGEAVTLSEVEPTLSVLRLLRERLAHTACKEGCAEGDCGACTVVIAELTDNGDDLHFRTVNACIQFAPALDGKALFTAAGLPHNEQSLHPLQQALVEHHGSQCGYCTPGFVMSMWQLYLDHSGRESRPSASETRQALAGNLCRCTGYKPILEAARAMFDLPVVDVDRRSLIAKLRDLQRPSCLSMVSAAAIQNGRFQAPKTLNGILQWRAQHPEATVLAGATDIGLWVTKQQKDLPEILYLGECKALQTATIDARTNSLAIGGGASLTVAYELICQDYPQLAELAERFASPPIRNCGTLGGNLVNGSPIGDSSPWLIALGATVECQSLAATRTIRLEDFYLRYGVNALAKDEILTAIHIPRPTKKQRFRAYKVAKRFDSDISAVCAAFCIELDDDEVVSARVAFGGMAGTVHRARGCEHALLGHPWNQTTLRAAQSALTSDYQPLSDWRASAENRRRVAANLLQRFYLETRSEKPLSATQVSVFAE